MRHDNNQLQITIKIHTLRVCKCAHASSTLYPRRYISSTLTGTTTTKMKEKNERIYA